MVKERKEEEPCVRCFLCSLQFEITHVRWAAALHLPLEECFTGRTLQREGQMPTEYFSHDAAAHLRQKCGDVV